MSGEKTQRAKSIRGVREENNSSENGKEFDMFVDFGIIIGPSGVGKTSVINNLKKRYGNRIEILKIGDIIRKHLNKKLERKGETPRELVGRYERTPQEDRAPDRMTEYIIERRVQFGLAPLFIEGKRAGLAARVVQEKANREDRKPPRIVRIYLTTHDPEVRYERIYNRQEDNENRRTLEEIRAETIERDAFDVEQWKKTGEVYPDKYYEINPFDPPQPSEWDIIIFTDDKNQEQTAEAVHQALMERELVKLHKNDSSNPTRRTRRRAS